jgi:hypothetical protein
MHRSNEWSTTPAQADRCIAKYIGVEYQSGAVGLGWIGLDWVGLDWCYRSEDCDVAMVGGSPK